MISSSYIPHMQYSILPKDLVETDRDVTIITSDSPTTGNGLSANL